MIHNIFNSSIVSNGSDNGRVSQGIINGLTISAEKPFTDTQELTVTYKSREDTIILVNGIGLRKMAGMSDEMGGYSSASMDTMVADGVETAGATFKAHNEVYGLCVDLGCLHLSANASEVEVKVRNRDGSNVFKCAVSSFFDTMGPEKIFKIHEHSDLEATYPHIERLYLANAYDGIQLWDEFDINCLIRGPFGSTVCGWEDLIATTMVRGNYETFAPTNMVRCYKSPDSLMDTVDIQLTGPDATNFTLLSRSVVVDVVRVSRANRYNARTTADRLDRMPADKTKMLRRQGFAMPSDTYRALANTGNDGSGTKKV